MKKLYTLILMLIISSVLYAHPDAAFMSVSHYTYRADYIGTKYNFTSNETTDITKNAFSFEIGGKFRVTDSVYLGMTYGYDFLLFNDDCFLLHAPVFVDSYFEKYGLFCSVSLGLMITLNESNITGIPAMKAGIGYHLPFFEIAEDYFISFGVKSTVSVGIWPNQTNISDMCMITNLRPLEIFFYIQ